MLPMWLIWSLASGSALVLLGIWVLRLSPRRPANVAVAVFAVAIGMRPVIVDLAEHFGHTTKGWLAVTPFLIASTMVLAWLALRFPDPASPSVRRAVLTGGVVALVSFLAGYGDFKLVFTPGGRPWYDDAGDYAATYGFNLHLLAFLVPLVALPVRAIIARDPETANRAASLASALTLYPAAFAAFAFLRLLGPSDVGRPYFLPAVTMLAATPVVAALWLYASHRGPAAASARNVALLTLAVPLLFVLNYLYGLQLPVTDIARIATVLFLVVAIVRGQLLSTDTAMRWTISRSSIAAAFIAAFFIASEAAQQFFGETLGSVYVGILAAGALVFAIAPLSRVADRLAEKAVPLAAPPVPSAAASDVDARALRVYERALRTAIGDGRITPDEEDHLAHIAHEMGIPHPEALRMRRAIESEHEGVR